jgi:Uncharacterized conserved protein (DUF2075)
VSDNPPLQPAYYSAKVSDFLRADPDAIYGALSRHHAHTQEMAQRAAWLEQIALLQSGLAGVPDAWLAFEFAIPRMGKRADAIILLDGIIFVVEFKVRAETFTGAAIEQVTDYALDLKNFHAGSHSRLIIPVVIATDAPEKPVQLNLWPDDVAEPVLSDGADVGRLLLVTARRFPNQPRLVPQEWMASGYKPTPTIIEAAQALYRSHRVDEITRSDAGAKNLGTTTARITDIVEAAKANKEKTICFVTGVPGAGKTLAGLNLATSRAQNNPDENAVFLSGNGPLVEVLQEALARDEHQRAKQTLPLSLSDARRKVKSFIQAIHLYRDEYLRSAGLPEEHVVVFDEAQRAWTQEKISKFLRERRGVADFGKSEPEFLIEILDRHPDWCVIVCLIGGGQEINDGEAGLTEWFSALAKRFTHWKIVTSDQLSHPSYHWGRDLRKMMDGLQHRSDADLHLSVSVRSFRAEKVSQFVNELIGNEPLAAAETFRSLEKSYPIVLTRSLDQARNWLRKQARGSERFGLAASSGALRLKPEGLHVKADIDAPRWFLNPRSDVRSSFYLEDPATEFAIQGLELDWVGVCWDADFRRADDRWSFHDFVGASWRNVNDPRRKIYLANAYRVLLTRARQGMVIYVPQGDAADHTRPPHFYDGIASYLKACGISELAPLDGPAQVAQANQNAIA